MTVALVGDGADEVFGGYARPMIERAAAPYRALVPALLRGVAARMLGEKPGTRSSGALSRRLAAVTLSSVGSGGEITCVSQQSGASNER